MNQLVPSALLLLIWLGLIASASAQQPNIVLILADDLGYGELGCYGQQKIRTPHLDELARQGMRFTQHYSGAPVCAPSRCVLLTGRHTAHAEIRGNRDSGNGREFPGQWPLSAEVDTIAEILKRAGYRTGGFGKWGLGPTDSSGSPLRQGFDRFFGYNCQRNAHSYYPPYLDDDEGQRIINLRPIPAHQQQTTGEIDADRYRGEQHASELIVDEALKFIDEHHRHPFFLYLPFLEPHVAMQPPQRWIDHYPESWDEEHGPYRGENGYLPHPRPRAAYAAMISHLDEHVGKVLKRLQYHGLDRNTVVIFTSDNGPTHRGRDPRWHVGGAGCDFFDSTAGLRGNKGSCYEGGIRVPCLVKWPGVVAAGSTSDFVSYFPDWFPTLARIGNAQTHEQLDGIDLNPVLRRERSVDRTDPLVWEFPEYGGIIALREGRWKLIRRQLQTAKPEGWELYDLSIDPGETKNLAETHPEIVQRLERFLLGTRLPNPNFPFAALDDRR